MEFGFTLTGLPAEGIVCWDRGRVVGLDVQGTERLRVVVDTFGRNSCQSQGLPAVITDLYRLQTSDHRLYLAVLQKSGRLTVLGGIKTGNKKLFIRAETGSFCEIEPVCVLDFYVHEDYQRQGLGKHLFEHFLAAERQTASSVGYDRPSSKLLAFLRKHYGLAHYVPQSNNFVVFSAYFHTAGQQGLAASPWTSVSQRPLTARKRQLQNPQRPINGLHQRGDSVADSPENLLQPNSMAAAGVSYGTAGRMPASSIPAFRTAANRSQLTQQNSQETNHYHEAGSSHSEQIVGSPINHGDLSVQLQSQRDRILPEETNISSAQRGDSPFTHLGNAAQATRSTERRGLTNDRQGPSYNREGSSSVAGGFRSGQHQAFDQSQHEHRSLLSQSGGRVAPWLPDQQFAAAGQIHDKSRAGALDTVRTALAAGAGGAKPVMYVKPPWAIDDSYQATLQRQDKHQRWGPPSDSRSSLSASASSWSLQAAAGRQRSGAGARDCLMW